MITRGDSVVVIIHWGAAPHRRGGRAGPCFVESDGSVEEEPAGILQQHSRGQSIAGLRVTGGEINGEGGADSDQSARVRTHHLLVHTGGAHIWKQCK